MFVFGGVDKEQTRFCDLYALNLNEKTWSVVSVRIFCDLYAPNLNEKTWSVVSVRIGNK
jgi:hypothetical protein